MFSINKSGEVEQVNINNNDLNLGKTEVKQTQKKAKPAPIKNTNPLFNNPGQAPKNDTPKKTKIRV